MYKTRRVFIAMIAIAVVGSGVFHGCKKDTEQTELLPKTQKLMGSCQTPQIVPISTVIMVGTVEYPVVGTAIVGNYDGRIYECNVSWVISPTVEGDDVFTMSLNATLKPEYHDIMLNFEPIMDNYIITITNPDMITAESIHGLWTRIVEICNANVVIDFRVPYILALSRETGINIFELAASPFFLEYSNQLSEFNAYFLEITQNNEALMNQFNFWLNEFIQAPIWEEGEVITEEHHRYYIAAQQLSHIYFGNNFGYIVEFGGVYYNVAIDRINSMMNSYSIFKQNLEEQFPQYVNLDKELQKNVIKGGRMMLPQYDGASCERRCKQQLDSDISDAIDAYLDYFNGNDYWSPLKKNSKNKKNALMNFRYDMAYAFDSYDDCMYDCWGYNR